jgi:ABC-type glycerol-3-phosphate transport system substrate-binding protein
MKHKSYLLMIPIVLALIFLIGFLIFLPVSSKAAIPARSTYQYAPVAIMYWHHNTGTREEYLNELIDEFNATNPYSITVVAEYAGGYGEIHDKVIDGLQNNSVLPNVVVAYPNSFADFARYGGVRFLDDYFNDPTIGITETADFYSGVLDYYRLGEYGNQLAGIQNGRSIEVMYYNADLLAGEGLTIPVTWEAFETACISITTETISGTIVGTDASRFATWLWSHGGELLSADLNTARFNEQPGIDSLILFQQLINDGYARLPLGAYEEMGAFGNGQAGFTFGSSAGIPYYRDSMNNGANDDWGVTHVPSIPGNEVVDSYGSGQGVLHHNEIADRASWLFIKWLTEREQTARWAAVSGYFPVRVSATTHISMTEKMANDPQYAQGYNLLNLGHSEPGIRGYNAIRGVIKDAVTDVLQNIANVTATLQIAVDEANTILATSGPDSAVIPPSGGTLTYSNTQGISATVQFPAGALVVTETVSYVPLDDLPTDGLAFALAPNLTFSQPVTITIHYRDEDIIGMDENSLMLYNYDWPTNSWVGANPCGGYSRNPDDNILQAAVCHFSDYGMMDWLHKIFLPITIK